MTYPPLKLTLVLTFLVTASGPSWAQGVGASFDYSCSAQPIRKALAEISVLAKTKLYVDEALQDEPIVLKVKAVTADTLMDKLSVAIGAEWRKSGEGMELWRSPEQWESLKKNQLKARTSQLAEAIKVQVAPLSMNKPFDQRSAELLAKQLVASALSENHGYEAFSRLQSQTPPMRALWKMVSMMGPRELARLSIGERIVWSNRPHPAQRPLEGDCAALGEELFAEQNLFASQFSDSDSAAFSRYVSSLPVHRLEKPPVRFVLAATKTLIGDYIKLSLTSFDESKAPVTFSEGNLALMPPDVQGDHARAAKDASNEPPLKVSQLGRSQLDFIRQSVLTNSHQWHLGSGIFLDAVLHPEDIDPLVGMASDAFLGLAEQAGENLVFYPDDTAFLIAMYAGMEGDLKPSVIRQTISGVGQLSPMQVREDGHWMLAAPMDLLQAYTGRTDRHAIGEFVRNLQASRFSSISETAKLVSSMRGDDFSMLAVFQTLLIDGDNQPGQVGSFLALKLMGSLDGTQINWLRTGNRIRFLDLTPVQAALAEKMVYSRDPSSDPYGGGPTAYLREMAGREATEKYPQGLPAETTLSFTWEEKQVFIAQVSQNGTKYSQVMDIQALARNLFMLKQRSSASNVKREIIGLTPATQRSITILIDPGRGSEQGVLKETEPIAGPTYTLASLPENLKKQLELQIAQIEGDLPEAPETAKPQAPPLAA